MTCIVGIVQDGEVWMGSDGVVSFGDYLMPLAQPKLFRLGELLIGVSGGPRVGHIFQHAVPLPPVTSWQDIYAWLCIDVNRALRHALAENGHLKMSEGASDCQSHILIGCRGRLFYMDGEFAVYQCQRPFETAGNGSEVAMGSLLATARSGLMQPRQRIEWALEAASEIMAGVGPPFTIEKL